MLRYLDLLESTPRVARDVAARRTSKEVNRPLALKFGREYFDGTREQGYGGYRYDGRWVPVAHRIIEQFGLRPGDRVLDVGCGKGFLVKDLCDALPGLEVYGLDISEYALTNAVGGSTDRLLRGTCNMLPFPTDSFAAVLAINTIHNLDPVGCRAALREIQRLAPRRGFVQVDAYRNEAERQVFEDWMLTARTYLQPDGWLKMFGETGYSGAYCWTILEIDPGG